MRVTQTMLSRNALYRLGQRREAMDDIQNRISSGRRVQKASDDPTAFSRAERMTTRITQNEQYLRNIDSSEAWIDNTVSLMQSLSEVVIQAKDMANRGADGQADANIRNTLADQTESLLQEAMSIVNSQYLNKSVFAGSDTQIKNPFVENAGVVSYLGNDQSMSRQYSENVSIEINVDGQSIMDTGVFDAMSDLITSLRANDENAIRATIDDLKTAGDKMLGLTALAGTRSSNLRLIRNRLEQTNIDLESFRSEARDARLDKEIVSFQTEQISYQAALQVTAKTINLNILQYLG